MIYKDKYIKLIIENLSKTNIPVNLEEDITAGATIVYHRAGNEKKVKGISSDGYRVGGGAGAMYGFGVYTTYDLASQLRPSMANMYGKIIIENKIRSMDDFLIFDYDVAKKIYKSNYTIDKQLKKILGSGWSRYKDNKALQDIVENTQKAQGKFTSEPALQFYEVFNSTLLKKCRGLVFTGETDGKVLICYDVKNIMPVRYSLDDGKTWKNVLSKDFYKKIKNLNPKPKDASVSHDISTLDSLNSIPVDRFVKLSEYDKNRYIDILIKNKRLSIPKEYIEHLPNDSKNKYLNYILDSIEEGGKVSEFDFKEWPENLQTKFIEKLEKRLESSEFFSEFAYKKDKIKGKVFGKLEPRLKKILNRAFVKNPEFEKLSSEQFSSLSFDDLKNAILNPTGFESIVRNPNLLKRLPEPIQMIWVKNYQYPIEDNVFNNLKSVQVKTYFVNRMVDLKNTLSPSMIEYLSKDKSIEHINNTIDEQNPPIGFEEFSEKLNGYYLKKQLEKNKSLQQGSYNYIQAISEKYPRLIFYIKKKMDLINKSKTAA